MSTTLSMGGCGSGADGSSLEPEPPDTLGEDGTVQRGVLTVRVLAEGEALATMSALGVGGEAGGVPDALVTVQRAGEANTRTEPTGPDGSVAFPDLLPGQYRVRAFRLLSDDEAMEVASSDPDLAGINALGGGGVADLDPPTSTAEIDVVAGRRGSLVISEIHDWSPVNESGSLEFRYSQARYVEVYNNADTTIFLDGRFVVHGFWFVEDTAGGQCENLAEWRLDPEGLWSEWHLRFPGSGREHPVRPGEAKVIATQAIDHDEVLPGVGLPDLLQADFEVVGTGQDVDNPTVPNMIQAGFRSMVDAIGRGFLFGGRVTLILADTLDVTALPGARLPLRDPDYRRFPAEKVLDVMSLLPTSDIVTFCDAVVHERFDRQALRILSPGAGNSVQRRVLGTTPDGRAILQRTLTTAADVERGERSPGGVP